MQVTIAVVTERPIGITFHLPVNYFYFPRWAGRVTNHAAQEYYRFQVTLFLRFPRGFASASTTATASTTTSTTTI